ncbi:hypothetical protein GS597_11270 [Synechococcales cyanobacterium C]|uniref:Capsule polysaccharide biosynthesis protein n=1 Tax=Petrachloros mirabilis ULC683 TaxID=2781853 RepID=A0A8K1ZZP1_9CYAN|nr:hypothetical protein [Petrachloros mirabilis]NCJ07077.1 hypothetical protein [Petrachloros mirabilis ULC683]
MPLFYKYYQKFSKDAELEILEESFYRDVIQRCRLLRNHKHKSALRMINSTWMALEEIINTFQPSLTLSCCTDFFVVDLLERVGNKNGIQFIGLARPSVKQRVMFLSNQEFRVLDHPDTQDINKIAEEITNPNFMPTKNNFNIPGSTRFLKDKSLWIIRRHFFDFLRIATRDPFNPEYLLNPKPGDDYYFTLGDYLKMSQLADSDWKVKLNNTIFEKRLFIGLQVNPECTVDYWIKDLELAQYKKALNRLVKCLTRKGYTIFLKEHPDMYGRRKFSDFRDLIKYPGLVFVPFNINAQYLIDNCKSTFTWTGTIGMQAAIHGRCAIIAKNMYYSTQYDFIHVTSIDDIDDLPKRIEDFKLPQNLKPTHERIASKIASTSVPGSRSISISKDDIEGTNILINSLNKYLPSCIFSCS